MMFKRLTETRVARRRGRSRKRVVLGVVGVVLSLFMASTLALAEKGPPDLTPQEGSDYGVLDPAIYMKIPSTRGKPSKSKPFFTVSERTLRALALQIRALSSKDVDYILNFSGNILGDTLDCLSKTLAIAGINIATAFTNPGEAGEEGIVVIDEITLKFFYLINETGSEVKVRVLADGQELFIQQISAQVTPSPGREAPPPSPCPAVELKIPVSQNAKELEVQELLHLGTRARQVRFDIVGFSQADAGFRIMIRKNGILLDQDYYPAR